MRRFVVSESWLARLVWQVLSVPLFAKIFGIGVVVGIIFGGVTLLQVRGSISRSLHQVLEEKTRSIARSVAEGLERPISTGDILAVNELLLGARATFPDVRYIIVRDAEARIIGHTFARGIPSDLVRGRPLLGDSGLQIRTLGSSEGLIFDATCPILEGYGGTLQLGVSDRMMQKELAAVTRSIFLSLALCVTIGAGLAVLLTHILTRPIRHLVQAVNRIRQGDFGARSEIFSADEIGRLAVAFNQMSESLRRYRQEVQDKEQARLALIEKIVHAQEEERKSISRELHDQVGQSLLALLLSVQSPCVHARTPGSPCADVESRIKTLIDDVRLLAWGMRPSILDDYGLDSALARHVEETSAHFGLPIDYQCISPSELERLPSQIEVTLFRIAQEAITNVVKHARATRASAVLLHRKEEVTLLVEDNGCGLDVESVRRNGDGCLGLTGMRERAALLGGTCVVESVPKQGTTIRVRIPLNGNGDEQRPSGSQ